MNNYNDKILSDIQQKLDKSCPVPKDDLMKLARCVATLPRSEQNAKLRLLVYDIEDLTDQVRWHLGQALLLLETQPEITIAGESDEQLVKKFGVPTGDLLLLKDFLYGSSDVLYNDLAKPRYSGTVGGWVFHMMIDSAIFRIISVMDRLAAVLWYAAELPKTRVYFRSKHIQKLHIKINTNETATLVNIAKGELLNFIIKYRDDFTHNIKPYSRASGITPSEKWKDSNGKLIIWRDDYWDAKKLFALGHAAYNQFTNTLNPTVKICEKKWPYKPLI